MHPDSLHLSVQSFSQPFRVLPCLCPFPWGLASQDLERKFARYGRVKEARVVRHPMSGESRGFAFVVMNSESEAEDVSAVWDMDVRFGGDVDWAGGRWRGYFRCTMRLLAPDGCS